MPHPKNDEEVLAILSAGFDKGSQQDQKDRKNSQYFDKENHAQLDMSYDEDSHLDD